MISSVEVDFTQPIYAVAEGEIMFDITSPFQSPKNGSLSASNFGVFIQYREFFAGAALATAAIGSLTLYGHLNPVVSPHVASVPYCEAARGGLFAQPINTLSNVCYLLAGLLILFMMGHDRANVKPNTGMRQRDLVARVFGWVTLFLGVGSAAFHGTLSHWGGLVDNIAMNLLVSFLLVYNLARLEGWSKKIFVLIFASLNGATTIYLLHDDSHSLVLFALLVVGAGLSEWMVAAPTWFPWVRHRLQGRRPWCFGAAIATFGIALQVWRISDTNAFLCSPYSLFQGHALWHLLTSVSISLLYFYLRAEGTTISMERRTPPAWTARPFRQHA